jgi:GntR family transcriptional repressor for pyruvate dehydrogenase complex
MTEHLQVPKISEAVAAYILDRISDGRLAPGEKLAPQRQLARKLGVGLSSLREGLHSLETLGVVEVKRGKGTFITRSTTQAAVKGLKWALGGPKAKLRELLEIRGIFETELAALAAQRATEEDIRELDGLLSGIRKAILQGDRRSLEEQDLGFHIAIAEAAQNRMAARLLRILYALVAEVFEEIPYTDKRLDHHREVAAAIGRGDPEAARIAVRTLVRSVSRAHLPREEPPEG